jgi:signal transduction histidine kinase
LSATKEMLHNAEKHSQASNVAVCLNFGAEELRLTIQDDGIGLPAGFQPPTTPATCPGIGLASVGQSVTVLGGNVDWSGNDDGGTAVSVSIPCAA